MNAQWKKFDGSDDQIREILNAKDGVIFNYVTGEEDHQIYSPEKDKYHLWNRFETKAIDEYMLCNPHPHADMIIEWARTGMEVYQYLMGMNRWVKVDYPNWLPGNKYSFNPDGDGK